MEGAVFYLYCFIY